MPCSLLIWILGTSQRKRKNNALREEELLQEKLSQPDRGNTQPD